MYVFCNYSGLLTYRVGGKSNTNDFTLSAEACLPIISAILAEIKNKIYPQRCFLNIDLPTNVSNHKVSPKLVCGHVILAERKIKVMKWPYLSVASLCFHQV